MKSSKKIAFMAVLSFSMLSQFSLAQVDVMNDKEFNEVREHLKSGFPGIPDKDVLQYLKDGGNYKPAPELLSLSGVPKGEITEHTLVKSKAYPDAEHKYWIYIPASYNDKKPTRLMVFLDGKSYLEYGEDKKYSFPVPNALDNLIYQKQIPPVIAVFIDPGSKGDGLPIYGGKDNRSLEYDSADGKYANFLVDEVLPLIQSRYNIAKDPECRAVMGASSGGSGAFGVAWHRPDAFRKVISSIGSYVNIRGSDHYISAVRQEEKKPIKVFLQDGKNEIDTVFGNWKLANEQMASSLDYKGYEYRFEQGDGGHNYVHMASLAGDAFRWIWNDKADEDSCIIK